MRTTALLAAGVLLLASPPALASRGAHEDGKVTIIRDEKGVPHVHADDLRSLFYGVGYAVGQDRLWQAEILRRIATGTFAEVMGAGSVPSDVQTRLLFGPPSKRAAILAGGSERTRTIFQSYADGMNAWIEEAKAGGKLPLEYGYFKLAPRTWTTDDSVAVFSLLASQFGWFGSDELSNAMEYAELVKQLGPVEGAKAFADSHWLDDPSSPTTDPKRGWHHGRHGHDHEARLPEGIEDAAEEHRRRSEAHRTSLEEIGLRHGPMSNAVLIGPRMSRDGKPILLGGPQMGYGAPQINHEIGIHGAGFEATGMQIAGWPLIPIGVGRGYAWSLTSGGSDNSDIFALEMNPANPIQYRYKGAWTNLDCRPESITVAGGSPVVKVLCTSVHGPVIAQAGGVAYAMNNAYFGHEIESYEAWLGFSSARSLEEFGERASKLALNFNVFYADAHGNIAHFHVGRIPVRAPGANPFFPQPGDGSSDWQGVIPWSHMPRSVNPERGWLVNWNNKPRHDWPNSSAGFWDWGPVVRMKTLENLVGGLAPRSVTPETLEWVNRTAGLTTDSPSGNARTVVVSTALGRMLDAVDASADPRLPGAVKLLRGWNWLQEDEDGDGFYDSPAVAVMNSWWGNAVASIVTPKLGPSVDSTVAAQIVYRLLQGSDAALPPLVDYLGGRTIGGALTTALVDALDACTAQYGTPDAGAWLQKRAEIVWTAGGIGAVPNTLWMNRGTYNQIVHLGEGRHLKAVNVVSPGQSGDFRSPHFADQLPLYTSWSYKPMRLTKGDQLSHAESVTRLRVPR